MRHQFHVVAVEAANVREVVAEALAPRVELLEVREAAGERVTPRIDDLRVRQHQMDHPDVQEIVRHLVDEVRAAGLALDPRALDVLLAELAQALPRSLPPAPRRRRRSSSEAASVRSSLAMPMISGSSRRPFHGRMAGQDLLEQRRAGARHADDEDRIRRIAAGAGALAKKSRVNVALQAPMRARVQVGVIADGRRGAAHCPSRSARMTCA